MQIVLPLFDRFTALDAVGPYEVLARLPGAEVTFAAATAGPVLADTGRLALVATASFDEVGHADVLVVPGGPGTRRLLDDPVLTGFVRRLDEHSTYTASVCTGSLVLAAAGLLDGLEATTHFAASELLERHGARYVARRVVRQGKVLTAAGVSAGIDLALTLAGLLAGDAVAEAIQLAIEYDPAPPYDAGSLAKASPATVELVRRLAVEREAAAGRASA